MKNQAIAGVIALSMIAGALAASPANAYPGDPDPYSCSAEDQTGGFGGQSVSCSDWSCYSNGEISIHVAADDSNRNPADVSGTARCNDGVAHCAGEDPTPWDCTDTDSNSAADAATECRGDSDEFWDSGLYVSCGAYRSTVDRCADEPDGCAKDDWCPATLDPLVKVCLDPGTFCQSKLHACAIEIKPCDLHTQASWEMPSVCGGASEELERLLEKPIVVQPGRSTVTMITDGVSTVAWSCADYTCRPFEPAVHLKDGNIGLSLY